MRFARVVSAYDCYNPTIDKLAEHAALDVMQLDYRWPTVIPPDDCSRDVYAAGFLRQLEQLRKPLYLDPQLRLITSAGGGNTTACVEAVADYLCEHGSAELPITAIRGDNQLDCLEELFATGVELRDINSGQRLQDLTRPLLSAHVELGGGPIQTALDEGSRLVVAGCYDQAAPLLATAISTTTLNWKDTDVLAQLAFASRCAGSVIDFERDHDVAVSQIQDGTQGISSERIALGIPARRELSVKHADVGYRVSGEELDLTRSDDFDWGRVQGEPASGAWVLQVEYLANYVAQFAVEIESSQLDRRGVDIASQLEAELSPADGPTSKFDVLEFAPRVDGESIESSSRTCELSVRYRSEDKLSCEQFVAAARNLLARQQHKHTALSMIWPEVQYDIARFTCELPRDTIAVSVDTRPASEWR